MNEFGLKFAVPGDLSDKDAERNFYWTTAAPGASSPTSSRASAASARSTPSTPTWCVLRSLYGPQTGPCSAPRAASTGPAATSR